jgi:hypothetical protein
MSCGGGGGCSSELLPRARVAHHNKTIHTLIGLLSPSAREQRERRHDVHRKSFNDAVSTKGYLASNAQVLYYELRRRLSV